MLPLVYQIYEEYSTVYIINIETLNQYAMTLETDVNHGQLLEQWIQEHCYYILSSHIITGFLNKLEHNLQLAKRDNDTEYIQYISQKLHLTIDPEKWEYVPNKIKIKLKPSTTTKSGFRMTDEMARLLAVSSDQIYKYKSEIVRLVHRYIYQNQLQNRYDPKVITPDDSLQNLLIPLNVGEIEYTYDNLPKYIPPI
jgi:hypothetical protein